MPLTASITARALGHRTGRSAPAAALLGVLLLVAAASNGADPLPHARLNASPTAPARAPITGFTAPARSVTISALTTGRIAEIPADEGMFIAAGAPALRLDTTVQQRRVEIALGLASSNLEIELAHVRRDQAQAELSRLQNMTEISAASEKERVDAAADLRAAELAVSTAEFRKAQAMRELALQQAMLEQMEVRAPFSGFITERLREVGDTVEDREAVLKLVQLDPLLVVVDCPLSVAGALRPGMRAAVQRADGDADMREAEVVFVNPVAEAASQTLRVKLHVPNSDSAWLGGMRVNVLFSQVLTPAANATVNEGERQ